METVKNRAESDKLLPTETDFDVLEDNRITHIASLYEEFEKARLEKNSERKNNAMEAHFASVDKWYEDTKNANQEKQKAALIKGYVKVNRILEHGLAKDGINDMDIQESDSEGVN